MLHALCAMTPTGSCKAVTPADVRRYRPELCRRGDLAILTTPVHCSLDAMRPSPEQSWPTVKPVELRLHLARSSGGKVCFSTVLPRPMQTGLRETTLRPKRISCFSRFPL